MRSRSTTLASVRLGYHVNRNVKMALAVFNLFDLFDHEQSDIDYDSTSRLPGEPADAVNDIHFHPVEPRTARVSLIARF